MLNTKILSSLERVFPDECPKTSLKELSGLRNEALSFQLAFKLNKAENYVPVLLRVESDLPINLYIENCVQVKQVGSTVCENAPKAGLYPDILLPKATNPEVFALRGEHYAEKGEKTVVNASADAWQAFWLTVNEGGKETVAAGEHTVVLKLYNALGMELLSEEQLTVQIVDALLPTPTLLYTNWLHLDCISDLHNEPLFTEKYWSILESYLQVAATHGMNMVLTPAFTPALDTPVGSERMNVQLVDIEKNGDCYTFDFARLKRFTDLCKKVGIDYLEHCHFFSQWGAEHAPNIYDTKGNRLFGWDTDSAGEEYGNFLRQYLTALLPFLKEEGFDGKVLYHISDEPKDYQIENYRKAKAQIKDLLQGQMCGDALFHYDFYEDGTVEIPIVNIKNAEPYIGRCDSVWYYYTGSGPEGNYSNRTIPVSPQRNRIIGLQLYKHKSNGFLHWGLNYYYDVVSHGINDPRLNPCSFRNRGGAAYFVYPNYDGTALPSMRQVVFGEALSDYRALQLLEQKKGRDCCEALMEKHFGSITFHTNPKTPDHFMAFRKELNQLIAE